jgi:hypothetical protein
LKAEFEVDEGFTFLQGVAAMLCSDDEGELTIIIDPQGEPNDYTSLGLLSYALDRLRKDMLEDDE